MIETTIIVGLTLYSQNNFKIKIPVAIEFNLKYYIKILIFPIAIDIKDIHVDAIVEIKDVIGNQEIFYKKKFYDELSDNFLRKRSTDLDIKKEIEFLHELCFINFKILKPKKKVYFMSFEKSCINTNLLESLKTSKEKIDLLYYIAEQYLREDYKPVITEIGKFGEYLTKTFLKKIKCKFSNFKPGVDFLANYKPKGTTKINYNFIGNMLYPIYYFRNQASHPDPIIPLDEKTATACIENLSCILQYLSKNQIKF